ncbi:histone-fold-containing protein [Lojkania enalia]|uniref:Histone-fold-containing protein n=1 Tax=Lojkania enalia TaxID=147567 RepID=A0A9P4N732_9PLEO|nr:histone-fold-containing protein [Didymosphaeria enalia]
MPYNNTPIAPSNEVSGQVSLPLARVQKIIAADPERTHVSKNASFAIALATEMFIQHLATTTHNVVKAERKPRRNIQYRDVASAVAKTDNLEFLVDVVPKTLTYGEFKKRKEEADKVKQMQGGAASSGQNGGAAAVDKSGSVQTEPPVVNGDAKVEEMQQNGHGSDSVVEDVDTEAMEVDKREVPVTGADEDEEVDPAAMQIEMEMRGPRANGTSPVIERRTSGFTAINGTK